MMIKSVALSVCLAFSVGCSALGNCPPEGDDVFIEEGTTEIEGLAYESSTWEGPRNKFPAKTFVHFIHDIGYTPDLVNSYVSFTPEGSDVSENAGNQGRIKCVDDHQIIIKNDTCEETFYIRVVAYAPLKKHAACSCDDRDDDGVCCNGRHDNGCPP
jgi:hypothetical protein